MNIENLDKIIEPEKNIDKKDEKSKITLKYDAHQMIQVIIPISLCMFATLVAVVLTNLERNQLYQKESKNQHSSLSNNFKHKFSNSKKDHHFDLNETFFFTLGFFACLVFATLGFLLLIYLNKMKLTSIFLSISVITLFCVVNTFFWFTIATSLDILIDLLSSFF